MAKTEPQADQVTKPKQPRLVAAIVILMVAVTAVMAVPLIWFVGFLSSIPTGPIWIQNLILLVTAAVVAWCAIETGRLRRETRNMMEEAKRSRE